MMGVEDFLRDSGLRLGEKPALVDGAVCLTASEIEPFSAPLAAALAGNGIRRGGRPRRDL